MSKPKKRGSAELEFGEGPVQMKAVIDPNRAGQYQQMFFLLDLQRRRKPIDIVTEVISGVSFKALEKLAAALHKSVSDFAAGYLDMSPSTVSRRKKVGRLNERESDRAVRFARLIEQATDLYEGDEATALHWLETPLLALGGSTPLDYARTETGFREVENLIVGLEHGMYA